MLIHLAVFLITLSGLIFEIGLTRIYSATIWYHFAFIAVSVVLLGWGLGGFALHTFQRQLNPTLNKAAVLVILYAATIVICLGMIVEFPFRIERLPIYFIAPLIPFFLAGTALSMIFLLHRETAPSLYFADLLGASLGALMVTFLLETFGGETALLLAAVTPLLAAAFLSKRFRAIGVTAAVIMLAAAISNEKFGFFRVTPGNLKAMQRQME